MVLFIPKSTGLFIYAVCFGDKIINVNTVLTILLDIVGVKRPSKVNTDLYLVDRSDDVHCSMSSIPVSDDETSQFGLKPFIHSFLLSLLTLSFFNSHFILINNTCVRDTSYSSKNLNPSFFISRTLVEIPMKRVIVYF